MKRIIEIPDKVVKAIQNGEDYRYDIHTAIAQSTPYNPSGDCISREALKEQVKNEVCEVCFTSPDERQCSPNCKLCTFNQLIDNAPTIEFDRLKGKWIPMSTDSRGYSESFKCSICGAYIYPRCLEKELDYNCCPYCGADMGGKEE